MSAWKWAARLLAVAGILSAAVFGGLRTDAYLLGAALAGLPVVLAVEGTYQDTRGVKRRRRARGDPSCASTGEERALASLRDDFAQDRMTMEEYEREVARVLDGTSTRPAPPRNPVIVENRRPRRSYQRNLYRIWRQNRDALSRGYNAVPPERTIRVAVPSPRYYCRRCTERMGYSTRSGYCATCLTAMGMARQTASAPPPVPCRQCRQTMKSPPLSGYCTECLIKMHEESATSPCGTCLRCRETRLLTPSGCCLDCLNEMDARTRALNGPHPGTV